MPAELSFEQIALVVGIAVANLGTIVGSYISLRIKVEKLGVHVDILRRDMNNLGGMIRKLKKE